MGCMHDAPAISPEFKTATRDILAALPKVVLHDHFDGSPGVDLAELQHPEALIGAVSLAVQEAATDGVVYTELRFTPELYTHGGLTLQEAVDCAVAGVMQAVEQTPTIDARLILTAMRSGGMIDKVAALTVDNHGALVVGFAVAGPEEEELPLSAHSTAFALLRENYIPFTAHVGVHGGIDAIAEALQLGASRLGHATRLVDDFGVDLEGIAPGKISSWVRDRHILIESSPTLEVELGAAESLGDHPLPLLQQLGFTCTVSPGNRSAGSMTDQFLALAETFDYGVEEFFDITHNAVNHAFISEEERQHLLETVILPSYEELADPDEQVDEDES